MTGNGCELRESRESPLRRRGSAPVACAASEPDLWRRRDTGDDAAREALVHRYLSLARQLAARYAGRGRPLDDLVQVANLGLVKAVDRYDPNRGAAFSSYAVPTIVGELRRHFRDAGWAVHVPRSVQERVLTIGKAVDRLSARHRSHADRRRARRGDGGEPRGRRRGALRRPRLRGRLARRARRAATASAVARRARRRGGPRLRARRGLAGDRAGAGRARPTATAWSCACASSTTSPRARSPSGSASRRCRSRASCAGRSRASRSWPARGWASRTRARRRRGAPAARRGRLAGARPRRVKLATFFPARRRRARRRRGA